MKAFDKNGNEVKPGDKIQSFRDETWIFRSVSQAPSPGKSGKVSVSQENFEGTREFYYTVFNLRIEE